MHFLQQPLKWKETIWRLNSFSKAMFSTSIFYWAGIREDSDDLVHQYLHVPGVAGFKHQQYEEGDRY